MLSEHQTIDEFFRQKEEDSLPDNSREEAHWQQMKTMLVAPGRVQPEPKRRIQVSRRIVSYVGGFAIVTIVTIAVFIIARHKKTTPAAAITLHKNSPAPHRSPLPAPTALARHTPLAATHAKAVAKKTSPRYTGTPIAAHHATIVKEDTSSRTMMATDQPDAATLLRNFYSQLEPKTQEFFIQNNYDTTLLAKEGTRLIVPAGAFVDKAGNAPRGMVKVVLKEFYSYDAILSAGLSTSSNGEQLVSGGMLYISAEADGRELKLQPSVNMTVKMPTDNYDGRMQLFTGNASPSAYFASAHAQMDTVFMPPPGMAGNKRINWTPAEQWQEKYAPPTIKVRDMRNNPSLVYYYGSKTVATFFIDAHKKQDKEEIKKELEKRYGYYYDKIKVKRKWSLERIELFTMKKSTLATIGDSIDITFEEAVRYKLVSKEDSLDYISKRTADSLRYYYQLGKLKREYSFRITNLGWMNCDRFNNDPRPKVEFTLNLGEGYEARNFLSQLVFTRFRSVMPGYYGANKLLFSSIPKNEPVQLICVGVKDGKVMACIQSLTTSAREVTNLVFEETTPEQFKLKLQALNFVSMN